MRTTHNPSGTPLTAPRDVERADRVRAVALAWVSEPGPLLEVLHAVQAEFGHIDPDDVPVIADVLLLSRADVHGVVSFYEDLRTAPPAAHQIRICRGEACQSRGADELAAAAQAAATTEIEVHEVFCLGNCALGPAGQLDGRLYGRLTSERLAQVAAGWSQ